MAHLINRTQALLYKIDRSPPCCAVSLRRHMSNCYIYYIMACDLIYLYVLLLAFYVLLLAFYVLLLAFYVLLLAFYVLLPALYVLLLAFYVLLLAFICSYLIYLCLPVKKNVCLYVGLPSELSIPICYSRF
jgi:hypothetical protein